jgi:hypothetical protein
MIMRKDIPCVMKLAQYLRYYERKHGSRLSPEEADKQATKEGFVLDHTGETRVSERQQDREQRKTA